MRGDGMRGECGAGKGRCGGVEVEIGVCGTDENVRTMVELCEMADDVGETEMLIQILSQQNG